MSVKEELSEIKMEKADQLNQALVLSGQFMLNLNASKNWSEWISKSYIQSILFFRDKVSENSGNIHFLEEFTKRCANIFLSRLSVFNDDVDAATHLDIMIDNFYGNGLFSKVDMDFDEIYGRNSALISAAYCFSHMFPSNVRNCDDVVGDVVFKLYAGNVSCSIFNQLSIIKDRYSIDASDYFNKDVEVIHKVIKPELHLRILSNYGGLERLLEQKSNVELVVRAILISDTEQIDPKDFLSAYKFMTDCISYLKKKNKISNDMADRYLRLILEISAIKMHDKKTSNDPKWRTIVNDLGHLIDNAFKIQHLVSIARHINISGKVHPSDFMDNYELLVGDGKFANYWVTENIKNLLNLVSEPEYHMTITRNLGIESIFSETDIRRMRGVKFEDDLGL